MIEYENLMPWRKEVYNRRMQKILDAHKSMSEFPESFRHHLMFETAMIAIDGMLKVTEHCNQAIESLPLMRFGRVLLGMPEFPEPDEYKTPRDVRKMAGDALIHAAALGRTKTCGMMLDDLKANINARDSKGNTALFNAVRRKRLGTAAYLWEHGAKILPNKEGLNPVLWACYEGCVPALNMFQHYGVDFNQPYSWWVWKKGLPQKNIIYPIEAAVCSENPKAAKAVQWLLDRDVSIDHKREGKLSIREVMQVNPTVLIPEIRAVLSKKTQADSQIIPTPEQQPRTLMQRVRSSLQRRS